MKKPRIRIRNFEILGFSQLKFEILGIMNEIPSISKKVQNPGFLVDFMYPQAIGFRSYLRIRRLLIKYYMSPQLHQLQKHVTPFIDSFSNSTGKNGELINK